MNFSHTAIAHRGGAGLAPENTMRAFEMSVALGVTTLETDVRVSADGVAVAFHDAYLRRSTGAAGRIRTSTWQELRSLTVAGESIVRLDTLLAAFPQASFLVDVKDGAAVAAIVDVIRRLRCADRVRVAGTWDARLQEITEATGASCALGWRGLATLMHSARIGRRPSGLALRGAVAAHLPTRLGGLDWVAHPRIGPRLVEMAHAAKLQAVTWTVNEPESMHAALNLGCDGVITDRPDVLREVLIARGEWQPFNPVQGSRAAREASTLRNTSSPIRKAPVA